MITYTTVLSLHYNQLTIVVKFLPRCFSGVFDIVVSLKVYTIARAHDVLIETYNNDDNNSRNRYRDRDRDEYRNYHGGRDLTYCTYMRGYILRGNGGIGRAISPNLTTYLTFRLGGQMA